MGRSYALEVDERCAHDHPLESVTVQRVPFGNEVKWQIRVYYECDEGCHISEIREEKPTRVLHTGGEEVDVAGL